MGEERDAGMLNTALEAKYRVKNIDVKEGRPAPYNTIHAQPALPVVMLKIVGHWHACRYLKYNEKNEIFLAQVLETEQ